MRPNHSSCGLACFVAIHALHGDFHYFLFSISCLPIPVVSRRFLALACRLRAMGAFSRDAWRARRDILPGSGEVNRLYIMLNSSRARLCRNTVQRNLTQGLSVSEAIVNSPQNATSSFFPRLCLSFCNFEYICASLTPASWP